MKKTLLALAALGTAGWATAQSSVTVFGIVDAAVSHGSGSLTNRTLLSSGANSSSRVGLRGTEDLGGGMAASFWLEAQTNADDGTGVATNSNNQVVPAGAAPAAGSQGLVFGRRSTVSLSGGWGEVRLGRDFTAHYLNRSATDPFGAVGVGTSQPQAGTLAGVTSTRASNMIGYFLPGKLGGLFGQVQYYLGENASGAANSKDGTGHSLRLGYASGPMTLSVAYGLTQYATGDIRSVNLGGLYDAGIAKVMAGYFNDRTASAVGVTGKGYTVGAIVPVGQGEIKLAHSKYGSDAGAQPETKKLALGYVHNLSKRTALYATYARVGNSGGARVALNSATTAANESSSGYDLGIRHTF